MNPVTWVWMMMHSRGQQEEEGENVIAWRETVDLGEANRVIIQLRGYLDKLKEVKPEPPFIGEVKALASLYAQWNGKGNPAASIEASAYVIYEQAGSGMGIAYDLLAISRGHQCPQEVGYYMVNAKELSLSFV